MTARREEVGTASEEKADEEEGGLLSALLCSQTDSERPIGSDSEVLSEKNRCFAESSSQTGWLRSCAVLSVVFITASYQACRASYRCSVTSHGVLMMVFRTTSEPGTAQSITAD